MTLPKGKLTDAVRALRRVFWVVGGFSCAINLLLLAPSLYMLQTYDRVLTSRNEGTLAVLTLLLVGLLLLEAALEFLRSRVLLRVSASLDEYIDGRIFDAMFAHALANRHGGERMLADLGHLRQFLGGKGLLAFYDAPWIPVFLFVVFLLNPWLGLFGLMALALLVALAGFNETATAGLHALSGRLGAEVGQQADAHLRNAEVIRALGMLGTLRERWLARQREYLAVIGEAADRGARIGGASRFLRMVLQSGILGFGAYLVLQDQLTAGGMIAASILLGRTLAPVDLAIGTWRSVVAARGAYLRLNAVLSAQTEAPERVALPQPQGHVAVEGLVVAAPCAQTPILKGMNFQVAAGRSIAIIGPSASGKSTLARALVGVWPSLAGTVRLDGADLANCDSSELGRWLGYLPQDVELFDGSIAENIARFGTLDSGRIVAAARKADVHDLILRLPQGYETRIGRDGLALSGGQRQRIALARALYGDPALIVLDEPNASLDEAGEAALVAAMRSLKSEGRTLFVVTHRLNLLAEVDAVLVMADGRIQTFAPSADIVKARRAKLAILPAEKTGAGAPAPAGAAA